MSWTLFFQVSILMILAGIIVGVWITAAKGR